jgi:hypothetical protein
MTFAPFFLSLVAGPALAGPSSAEFASALSDFTGNRVTLTDVRRLSCMGLGYDEPTEAQCNWQQRIGSSWKSYSTYVAVDGRGWHLIDEPNPKRLAVHAPPRLCLEAERASQGTVFCTPKYVSFVLAGRTAGSKYSIYNYRYRFLTHRGGVMHGGQRLIVFQGDRYVGNYMLLPHVTVSVSGTKVVLKGDGDRKPVRLDFSRKPPSRILVNGEEEWFDRPRTANGSKADAS